MTDIDWDAAGTAGFESLSQRLSENARKFPNQRALSYEGASITYAELDTATTRFAVGLHSRMTAAGSSVAVCSATTDAAVLVFLGTLRAGCIPVLLATSSTGEQLISMIADSEAAMVFVDEESAGKLGQCGTPLFPIERLKDFLAPVGSVLPDICVSPDSPFDIIYSSGTTGRPKGIVHSHSMRIAQIKASDGMGLAGAVAVIATPIYSNTTMAILLPTLATGGVAVIHRKFDARRLLEAAELERATHVMLVPVQYDRIMALPDFDEFDLSAFRMKFSTGAPFTPALKADVLRRWPGELVEIYAMTEGGGTALLMASEFPNKLHTVGLPAPGSDIRIIDPSDAELPRGAIGEVVGRSSMMMTGYHRRDVETGSVAWYDSEGNRFIRHGDLGMFDEDGFLILMGRTKDMIISGGFNLYPQDIENVMMEHPGVREAAVIGVDSATWGETPFGYYVPSYDDPGADRLLDWVNRRVGKTQRLSGIRMLSKLPRSAIGKVLKRELREMHDATP